MVKDVFIFIEYRNVEENFKQPHFLRLQKFLVENLIILSRNYQFLENFENENQYIGLEISSILKNYQKNRHKRCVYSDLILNLLLITLPPRK